MQALFLIFALAFWQEPPAVEIYGQGLSAAQLDKELLPLFVSRYQKDAGLELTPEEFEQTRAKFSKGQGASRSTDWFVRLIAEHFKVQRALYRKHGGRVALSAFGTHTALEGMVAEMKLLEKQGKIRFANDETRERVFKRILETRGDGVTQGKNADAAFAKAPWD